MGIGTLAHSGCGRSLVLGQPVDVVIQQQNRQIHVVADRVNPVTRTDGATVAIARDYEYVQIRTAAPHAAGNRKRASMKTVKPVGLHVVRKAAGAPDSGNNDGLFRKQLLVAGPVVARHSKQRDRRSQDTSVVARL